MVTPELAIALNEMRAEIIDLDADLPTDSPTNPRTENASEKKPEPTAEKPAQETRTPQMLPPPHGMQFDTRQAAESFLTIYCAEQGYESFSRRSKPSGKRGSKVNYHCRRGGPRTKTHQDSESIKVNCPVEFTVDCLERTGYKWEINSTHTASHNHPPIISPFAISKFRKIDDEGRAFVKTLTLTTRLTCRAIWLALRAKDKRFSFVRQEDVKDLLRSIRMEEYGDYTSTQYFIFLMAKHATFYDYECDETGRLKYAFWTLLKDHKVLKENSELLIMDNTYKCNLFDIPLFEIITQSPTGTVLHLSWALGPAEDVAFFTWALLQEQKLRRQADADDPLVCMSDWDDAQRQAIQHVYKMAQLQLCLWHILKNFVKAVKDLWQGSPELAKTLDKPVRTTRNALADIDPSSAEPSVDDEDYAQDPRGLFEWFRDICYSPTISECESLGKDFECHWEDEQQPLVDYFRRIFPYRAQFCTAYTSSYRNYGQTTSSLGESGHWSSKSFMAGRNNELAEMFRCLRVASEVSEAKYEARIAKETVKLPQKYQNSDLFRHIVGYISKAALAVLWVQHTSALLAFKDPKNHPLGPCTDHLRAQMGLPCKHYIYSQCLRNIAEPGKPLEIETVKALELEEISPHWVLRSGRWNNDPIRHIRHPISLQKKSKEPRNAPHKLPENFKPSNSRRARKARARRALRIITLPPPGKDASPPATAPPRLELDAPPLPTPMPPPRTVPLSQTAREAAMRIPSRWEETRGGSTMVMPQRIEQPRAYPPLPPGWQRPLPAPAQPAAVRDLVAQSLSPWHPGQATVYDIRQRELRLQDEEQRLRHAQQALQQQQEELRHEDLRLQQLQQQWHMYGQSTPQSARQQPQPEPDPPQQLEFVLYQPPEARK